MSKYLYFLKKRMIFLTMILGALFFLSDYEVCAASKSYVSKIAIMSGTDAKKVLEDNGYTVLPQNLNLNDKSVGKKRD